jgi:hypothetical protein
LDFDLFGCWLIHPASILAIDDVAWSVHGPHTRLTIDNMYSHIVPEDTVAQLLGVI